MGQTLLWQGEFTSARKHLEQGAALYDPQQHRSLAVTYGIDPGVILRGFASDASWYLGYPDEAVKTMRTALSIARDLSHPVSLAFALVHAAWSMRARR